MITVAIIATLYLIFFVAVEVVARKTTIITETSRKFVHIIAGVTAAMLPLFMTFPQISILSLMFIPIMLASRARNIFSSIHSVDRHTYGEVYFPLAILITSVLFPEKVLFIYGLLVMAISDGLAGIVGTKYGRRKYTTFWTEKSYVGSTTFFTTALVIGLVVLATMSSISLAEGFVISLIAAALLTIVEAISAKGLDNLILPPIAALLLKTLVG
jgi:phytol kinase